MAIYGNHLRVSIPAFEDAVEISWVDGQWKAESGEVVEIEFDAAPEEFRWRNQIALEEAIIGLNRMDIGPCFDPGSRRASTIRIN